MVSFIIQKHVKRDLVIHFIFVEINIACIIRGADHILYAGSDFKYSFCAHGRTCFVVEGNIIVKPGSALVYITNKFQRQHGSGINVRLIPVANAIKIIKKRIRRPRTCAMINGAPVVSFQGSGEDGFPCAHIHTEGGIIHSHGDYLTGAKGGVGNSAKIIACLGGESKQQKRQYCYYSYSQSLLFVLKNFIPNINRLPASAGINKLINQIPNVVPIIPTVLLL